MPKPTKYQDLIHRMTLSGLNTLPFHNGVKGISRYAPKDFPMHLAIHKIERDKDLNEVYTHHHKHRFPEINILLGDVKYNIRLGDEEYIVKSPKSIWVPAGLEHSANLISGNGYFVCIILDKEYTAEKANVKK